MKNCLVSLPAPNIIPLPSCFLINMNGKELKALLYYWVDTHTSHEFSIYYFISVKMVCDLEAVKSDLPSAGESRELLAEVSSLTSSLLYALITVT